MLGVTCLVMRLLLVVIGLRAAYANGPCPVDPQVSCPLCSLDVNNEWNINCGNVQLDELPNITFGNTNRLVIRKMLFNSNRIKNVPLYKLSGLTIKELGMQANDLRSTNFLEIQSLQALEILDLSENSKLVTDRRHFSFLTNLKVLKMVNSKLVSLDILRNPLNLGSHLANLEIVIVSHNTLGSTNAIHPDTFHQKTKLARFEATNSLITNIDFLRVSSLSNLRILALQRNEISAIGPNDTQYLSSLRKFDISNNSLTSLSAQVMDNLPMIKYFYWAGNPVECGANVSWLPAWKANNPNVSIINFCISTTSASFTTTPSFVASTSSTRNTSSTEISNIPSTNNQPQQTTRRPSQRPATNPLPTLPPASFPQDAIIAIAVAGPIVILAIVIIIIVVIKRKKRNPGAQNSSNVKYITEPKSKDDETYHYYSYPIETGPAGGRVSVNMEDRPLPIPGETKASSVDGHGYLKPETTKKVEEYLELVISAPKTQPREPNQLHPDSGYIDFDPSTGDNQYETLPNRDETNDTYEDLAPHQKSIRGHENSTYL